MKKIKVQENMSRTLVTINWNAPIQEAADLLEENRFRHLPVVDAKGLVVGILSSRDINRAVSPKTGAFFPKAEVSEYMSWPVVTIDKNLSIKEAAEGMLDEKISAFLVTERDGSVAGIITSDDLLAVLIKLLSQPDAWSKVVYSPVVAELLREVETVGI